MQYSVTPMKALNVISLILEGTSSIIIICSIIYTCVVFFKVRKYWKTNSLDNLIISLVGSLLLIFYNIAEEFTTKFSSPAIVSISLFMSSTFILIYVNQLNYSFTGIQFMNLPLKTKLNPKLTNFYWAKVIFIIACIFALFLAALETFARTGHGYIFLGFNAGINALAMILNILQIIGSYYLLKNSAEMMRTMTILLVVVAVANALSLTINNFGVDIVIVYFIINRIQNTILQQEYNLIPYALLAIGTAVQAVLTVCVSRIVLGMHRQFVQFTQQAGEAEPIVNV